MRFGKKIVTLMLAAAMLSQTTVLFTGCNGSTESGEEDDRLLKDGKYEDAPALKITEIMVKNHVSAVDENGECSSWVEFYNDSSSGLKLSDYAVYLGGEEKTPLPAIDIPAGEYAIVFFNGKSGSGSVPLTLKEEGHIAVFHGEFISHSVKYANHNDNYSFVVSNERESSTPTPGYSVVRDKDDIVITEIMASNSVYIANGSNGDWVEIYNDSATDIDLSEYYISTDKEQPFMAVLPDVTLKGGEYMVICCEKDVPFKLSKDGESVYIRRKDGVLAAAVTFDAMEENTSWTYDCGVVDYPTPGRDNTLSNSLNQFMDREGLIINEVISSNTEYYAPDGGYYDIVELYNNSDKAIELSEYYLSDKGSELQRYQLPDKTLEPWEYFVAYCSSDSAEYAPFGISSAGEKLYVSNADGYITDAVEVPEIPVDRSWGRSQDGFVYFTEPSIGEQNGEGYKATAEPPVPSVKSGVYSQPQTVTFSYEGTMYYTTDGSRPTKDSKVYDGEEISVSSTMAIRAIVYNKDMIPSDSVTFNYLIDIPDYTLPIVKLSTADSALFGSDGIYTNYNSHEEIMGNMAFYLDGNEEFSINCGIKIFGAYSRRFDKKSLQIEFRKEYGTSRLEYPIFGEDGLSSFSNIVLRSGSQASYLSDSMFTDEFLTSLASESGNMESLMVQDYRPCNLYINGEYFGVYFIREKIDDDFIADNLGVSEESVTIIDKYYDLKYGSSYQGWDDIWEKIYSDKVNFSKDENYQWLADQINLESFSDMIIMRAYSGDLDAGNIRFFKSEEYDNGRWNFILYDNDISFRSNTAAKTRFDKFLHDSEYVKIHALFRALMENDQFKEFFLARLAFHLNSTLSPEYVGAHLDKMIELMEPDMPYQVDCWKHIEDFYLPSMDKWYSNLDFMRSLTTETRIDWFVDDIANALDLSEADIEKYMGEEFVKYLEN